MTAAFDPARFSTPEEQERWFATLALTVGVDFDGTLHPYTAGWTGSTPADERPMPGARAFLLRLRDAGDRVVIFSTRATEAEGLEGIRAWLEREDLDELVDEVTHVKPPAVAYVDDRSVVYADHNWDECFAHVERLSAGRAHGAAPAREASA